MEKRNTIHSLKLKVLWTGIDMKLTGLVGRIVFTWITVASIDIMNQSVSNATIWQ